MWKNHVVILTRYDISVYIISSQKTMAEAKTDIRKNHQSKLLFIPEWDLRPVFNLEFPGLSSGYSLREVTTRDMFP